MMRSVKILSMAAAISVLAAPGVRADKVTVKGAVPFDFVVAGQSLPSGEYRFVRTDGPGILHVYSTTTWKHVATLFCRALPTDPGAGTQLVFEKHGRQHFLRSIQSEDGSGLYLPETRSEREAQARARALALAEAHAAGRLSSAERP
jgi:hypothetical protein